VAGVIDQLTAEHRGVGNLSHTLEMPQSCSPAMKGAYHFVRGHHQRFRVGMTAGVLGLSLCTRSPWQPPSSLPRSLSTSGWVSLACAMPGSTPIICGRGALLSLIEGRDGLHELDW